MYMNITKEQYAKIENHFLVQQCNVKIDNVNQSLLVCGKSCEFCNGSNSLGGGKVKAFYLPYFNWEKEIAELNETY